MSRRQKKDYESILSTVQRLLPGQANMKEMIMDFEMAAWSAVGTVFPNVKVCFWCYNFLHDCNTYYKYMQKAVLYFLIKATCAMIVFNDMEYCIGILDQGLCFPLGTSSVA